MKNLPFGWTSDYTLKYLYNQIEDLNAQIASLRQEIMRLDQEKQTKRGPKAKPTAQGDARPSETTLDERTE